MYWPICCVNDMYCYVSCIVTFKINHTITVRRHFNYFYFNYYIFQVDSTSVILDSYNNFIFFKVTIYYICLL